MKHTNTNDKGYVLFYVIIAGSLFAGLATSVLISTLRELEISEQEMNAVKARFAAESGIECITYWQTSTGDRSLDSTGPQNTIYCGTIENPTADFTNPEYDHPTCVPYEEEMRIGPFDHANDQCADVIIKIEPFEFAPTICATSITTHGYSDCSASPSAQRSIWFEV